MKRTRFVEGGEEEAEEEPKATEEGSKDGSKSEESSPDWEVGFCDCRYLGTWCCLLAFLPIIGDRLVMARALSEMEGGGSLCFFTWCLSAPLGRAYMREVYRIEGHVGWDCCLACCFRGCAAAQMLGHVYIAGAPERFPPTNHDLPANFVALPRDCKDCFCLDPCNFLHTMCCIQCTSAAHVTAATGLPTWLTCLYSNYCFNHHIIRKNYGLPGVNHWSDCLEPFLCTLLMTPATGFICSWMFCAYFTQMLENERSIIKLASERGVPRLFLASTLGADASTSSNGAATLPAVAVQHQPVAEDAPDAASTFISRDAAASWGPWLVSYGVLSASSFWLRSRLAAMAQPAS